MAGKIGKEIKMVQNIFAFQLICTNAAGFNPKQDSFHSLINKFRHSVITVQESKLQKSELIRIPGYQVFEKVRKK